MCIWRFLLLFVVFVSTVAVAAGDRISGPANGLMNMFDNQSGFISVGQNNPWALPQIQTAPFFPGYYGSSGQADSQSSTNFNSGADSSHQKRNNNQSYQYSGDDNPYHQSQSVPPQYLPKYNQKYNQNTVPEVNAIQPRYGFQQRPRYVTPEILEALKKQQMRIQQTPTWQYNYYRNYRIKKRRDQNLRRQWLNNFDTYNYRTPELTLPAYPETLADESLLYRGALPIVPDAAIGGIAPLGIYGPLSRELPGQDYGYNRNFNPLNVGPFGDFVQR